MWSDLPLGRLQLYQAIEEPWRPMDERVEHYQGAQQTFAKNPLPYAIEKGLGKGIETMALGTGGLLGLGFLAPHLKKIAPAFYESGLGQLHGAFQLRQSAGALADDLFKEMAGYPKALQRLALQGSARASQQALSHYPPALQQIMVERAMTFPSTTSKEGYLLRQMMDARGQLRPGPIVRGEPYQAALKSTLRNWTAGAATEQIGLPAVQRVLNNRLKIVLALGALGGLLGATRSAKSLRSPESPDEIRAKLTSRDMRRGMNYGMPSLTKALIPLLLSDASP